MGGWVDRRQQGGSNELLYVLIGWVGGWVGRLPFSLSNCWSASSVCRRMYSSIPLSLAYFSIMWHTSRAVHIYGGWVGGWVEENEAVRMRCCTS